MNPFSSFTLIDCLKLAHVLFNFRYVTYAECAKETHTGFLPNFTYEHGNISPFSLLQAIEMPILASAQYVEKNTESETLKLAAKTIQTLPAKSMTLLGTAYIVGTFKSLFFEGDFSTGLRCACYLPSFALLFAPGMLALAKGCANYAENEDLAEKIENASEIYMNAIKVLNIAIGIIALTAPIYFGTATLSLTTVIAVISVGSMIYNALETNNLLPAFETSQEAIA